MKKPAGCEPVFRLSVICVGQTWELLGFNDPAREMPTPLSEYIPLRAALRHRRPAYFFAAGWQSGNEREFSSRTQRVNRMIDENWDYLRARRNNVSRYRRLLQTELTDLERRFIERRLKEEKSAMESLTSSPQQF